MAKTKAMKSVRVKAVSKAMAKAKAKTKAKAKAKSPPKVMTDKEVREANQALTKLGYKPEIESNPKAKGDMVAVMGGKGKRKGGKGGGRGKGMVIKRPSAKAGRDGPLVVAHGLKDIHLTPYDLVKFNAMMSNPENAMSVPPEILAEWKALKTMKGKPGQHDAQDAIRRAWNMDSTWGHPMIKVKIERTHTKSIKVMDKAMIWPRICTKLGGEANATQALKDKEILCVTSPHDSQKRLYIMREHVSQEAWGNASTLGGTFDMGASDTQTLVDQWMAAHDNGMDSVLNWTDEADHDPMPVAPALPMPAGSPAQPMPLPTPADSPADPHYNGGPTPEAKMEAAIKRFLSQVCSIKSRPVSVPALYQYQYMY